MFRSLSRNEIAKFDSHVTSNVNMNNDVKTKILAQLGSGKKNAKELAQVLKPTSKSDINKILYALLKDGAVEKHEGTPPSWTLKGRPASPGAASEGITLIVDVDGLDDDVKASLKANIEKYQETTSFHYVDSGDGEVTVARIAFWAARANGQLVVIATATDVEAVTLFLTSAGVNVEVCENTWEDIRVHLE